METEEYLENLQAQQLSELTTDFDYAFELQMQELVETSSAANLGAAQFLAEDIADYERKRWDRDLAEAEASQLRENLNRMIHDQAFAREILNVPEAEWKDTGDNLERPYAEGSTTWTAGSFRVYSKGLVMETAARDDVMKMRLGGVGIVICDMNDCPIFELRKPLDLGAIDGDFDVEFSALMEGLNAAVTLGLKRVHALFDNDLLHQYITRKGPPRTNKIVTLVDQVSVLQQKFVSCNMSLVGQKEVRFAFKLARDAVVSQAIQLGKNMIESCAICMEDTDLGQIFSIDNCLHQYCFTCMKKHVEAKLLLGKLPECPHEGCKTEMKLQSCKAFLTPDLYAIMSERAKEASIPATEKIYCPYPRCSALMSKREVEGYAVSCSAAAQQAGARQCMTCLGFFCINCKVPWHANVTCFDYKRQNPHPSREDATLKNLATQSHWRQCRNCSHMVELAHGCYHIYCRCGHEFCYTCGADWRNKKATCKCPIWDERNIVYEERNRRQQ